MFCGLCHSADAAATTRVDVEPNHSFQSDDIASNAFPNSAGDAASYDSYPMIGDGYGATETKEMVVTNPDSTKMIMASQPVLIAIKMCLQWRYKDIVENRRNLQEVMGFGPETTALEPSFDDNFDAYLNRFIHHVIQNRHDINNSHSYRLIEAFTEWRDCMKPLVMHTEVYWPLDEMDESLCEIAQDLNTSLEALEKRKAYLETSTRWIFRRRTKMKAIAQKRCSLKHVEHELDHLLKRVHELKIYRRDTDLGLLQEALECFMKGILASGGIPYRRIHANTVMTDRQST